MSKLYFEIAGDVTFAIEVTEADASLFFDVYVKGDAGSVADLQCLKFNLNDHQLRDGLTVTGLNTDVEKDIVPFDAKLLRSHDVMLSFAHDEFLVDEQFCLTFKLSHRETALTIDNVFDQPFATRLVNEDTKMQLMAGLASMFQSTRTAQPAAQAA